MKCETLHLPRLLLVSGPTAAGKTSATQALHALTAKRRRVAVVERDRVMQTVGRTLAEPGTSHHAHNARSTFRLVVTTAAVALDEGYDVAVVSTFSQADLQFYRARFWYHHPHAVLLLPATWGVNKARREQRIAEARPEANEPPELEWWSWDNHQRLYETMRREQSLYDEVIDTSSLTPQQVAGFVDYWS